MKSSERKLVDDTVSIVFESANVLEFLAYSLESTGNPLLAEKLSDIKANLRVAEGNLAKLLPSRVVVSDKKEKKSSVKVKAKKKK